MGKIVLLMSCVFLLAQSSVSAQRPAATPATAMSDVRSRKDTRSTIAIMRRVNADISLAMAQAIADSMAMLVFQSDGQSTAEVLTQHASVHALADAAKLEGAGTPLAYAAERLADVALRGQRLGIRFIAMRELPSIVDQDRAIFTLARVASENGPQSEFAIQRLLDAGEKGVAAAKELYLHSSSLTWGDSRLLLLAIARDRKWN